MSGLRKFWQEEMSIYDDDENITSQFNNDQDIESYIIEVNKNKKTDHVKQELIDIIEDYDIERKISDYKELLYNIYIDVIETFVKEEVPFDILNKDNRLLHCNFIDWAYEVSKRGIELENIKKIYDSLFAIKTLI